MCGNFGLLLLGDKSVASASGSAAAATQSAQEADDMNESFNQLSEVSRHGGIRLAGKKKSKSDQFAPKNGGNSYTSVPLEVESRPPFNPQTLLPPIRILEAQTACTEVRGGQAGGYSCVEFIGASESPTTPICTRVRLVARKRHPLAADLAKLFSKNGGNPGKTSTVTGESCYDVFFV